MRRDALTRVLRRVPAVLGPVLFVVAIVVIDRELQHLHLHQVLGRLRDIGAWRFGLAALLALASYGLQTTYDLLALRYLGQTMPFRRVALGSFIGVSLSNNVGHSLFTGASVRLRLYGDSGMTATQIATLNTFCSATVWLGFLALAGIGLLVEPSGLEVGLALPIGVRWLGAIFAGLAVAYLAVVARRRALTVRGVTVPLPTPRLAALQIAAGALDWGLAGTALYMLLPRDVSLSLAHFLPLFLLAQVTGLVSQVPGGLGVFESVLVLALAPWLPSDQTLGCLVAYRVVYYLLPLGVAAALLGGFEVRARREVVSKVTRAVSRLVAPLAPPLLAVTTFAAGVVLLISGALPAVHGRMAVLRDLLPLPALELTHFLASLTGFALLLLAWAVYRRVDVAWLASLGLLAVGAVFSLAKGLDWEEALILAVFFAALLPSRRYFYRRASLLAEPLSAGWLTATALVVAATVWLGLFAYRHVEYSGDLWWRFAFHADAPRFLRAMVGVVGAAFVFGLARLLRTARPRVEVSPIAPDDPVRAIVAACPNTAANLVLLGDKAVLLNESRTAFIMYAVAGRSWVAMGDPVGPVCEHASLLWRFREESHRHGCRAAFYEVGRENLYLYLDMGMSLHKLGEEAVVPLEGFSLEGHGRKELRYVVRRLEGEGLGFEIVPREGVAALLPELEAISDGWLELKATREKRFSLGYFNPAYLQEFPVAVVRGGDGLMAFTNLWLGAREELSCDLMRHRPEAPRGVMEYLFIKLMQWGAEQGFSRFNLGMVPFKGLESRALAPLWHRVGGMLFRHGEAFYNFKGLNQFKEKFNPQWTARYLAAPGGLGLPTVLADVAALVSGGLGGVVRK